MNTTASWTYALSFVGIGMILAWVTVPAILRYREETRRTREIDRVIREFYRP